MSFGGASETLRLPDDYETDRPATNMKKSLLPITVLTSCLIVSADLCAQDSRSRSRRSGVPRPLLYAYPENPGNAPLAEVRKSMLEQFDADKDGFLNKTERNAMRLVTKKLSDERHDEIRRARERRGGGREGGSPKPPERWLAAYDKNKNGRFDGDEWDTARGTEIKNVTARYDANKNGKIDDDEKQRLIDNLKKNNYNPYDNYIRTIVAGLRGERSGNGREHRSRWKEFDTDGDGKASREELAAIRKHESQAQEKP